MQWQKWDLRIGFSHRESLVLHEIGYRDGERLRPICHRASIAELVIPYGDPNPTVHFKNVFDTGEYGMGPLVNALELGCDCVGEITYMDAACVDNAGHVVTLPNAICIHEEDYGILWKHHDDNTGRTDVARSRRLVDLLHRHGGQLRVRVLLVPLPGRHDPVRGQADRHRADRRRARGLQPAPRHAGRAGCGAPATTSTSSPPAWTWTWTASRTWPTRSSPAPIRWGRTTRTAPRSRPAG